MEESLELGAEIIGLEEVVAKLSTEVDAELVLLGDRTGLVPGKIKEVLVSALLAKISDLKLHAIMSGL